MSRLTMFRGDTLPMTATIVVTGTTTPVDLTGGTLRFTLKNNLADSDSANVLSFTSPARITIAAPTTGVATWSISAGDMPAYAAPMGSAVQLYWDLQMTDVHGAVFTVDSGTLVINPDVSHTTP